MWYSWSPDVRGLNLVNGNFIYQLHLKDANEEKEAGNSEVFITAFLFWR